MTGADDISDRYVAEYARLDPCAAAMMGIAGQESELTDFSPEGYAAREELTRATLAELAAVPGAEGTVAGRVLGDWLRSELALAEAGVADANLNVIDGPVQRLRQAVELVDQGASTDWEAVLSRLRGYPAALAGLRVSLTEAARDGRVAARRQVAECARQTEQTAVYFTELAGRCAAEPLAGAVAAAAGAAGRAVVEFGAFLAGELLPLAPERDGVGRDRYVLEVRRHLGTELDLEETYAWGWEELGRIEAEMRRLAAEIRPGAELPEVFAALDADPEFQAAGRDRFRAYLQELADAAIADLDGVHFDLPAPLRRIECRIPPTDAGGVYYLAPTEDLERPGQVWWTVRDRDAVVPTWTVPATMYHEGVPGHHLQLGTSVLNPQLNRFRRMSAELHPGACEGWGLYAERLMDELGYYAKPAHKLGMLASGQQLRAARVVLDIGMHLELPIPAGTGFHEGERWTRELGLEFLCERLPDGEAELAHEIDRYLGFPGQALAYKVGERVWLRSRDAARARHGASFDLRAFHREALALGPMGLDLLAELLGRL
jgi:uncharacterized protein (DUF885 family)